MKIKAKSRITVWRKKALNKKWFDSLLKVDEGLMYRLKAQQQMLNNNA